MQIQDVPFMTMDWNAVAPTEHPGITASWEQARAYGIGAFFLGVSREGEEDGDVGKLFRL